jgi:TFIIF-interacting CTD phosphatase-like protein
MTVLSLISYTIKTLNNLLSKVLFPLKALLCKLKQKKSKQLKRIESGYLNRNLADKLTIILDLENILVYPSFNKLSNYKSQIIINSRIYLYIRPHLDIFLNDLSENCELVVFTTYQKHYADQIINLIDKNKCISRRFYKEDCTNKASDLYKDVRAKGFEESRVIIIDDYEEGHLTYKSKIN